MIRQVLWFCGFKRQSTGDGSGAHRALIPVGRPTNKETEGQDVTVAGHRSCKGKDAPGSATD